MIPLTHKIALLATLALTLCALRYLCNFLATHGGLPVTIIAILIALSLAKWVEPNRDSPP